MTKLLDESLHDTQYELHRPLSLQLDFVNRTNHLKRETFPMGHEARLQIFPEDHELVQDWLSGRQDGNSIQHCFHLFYAMRKGFRPEPFFERDDPQQQEEARSFVRLAQQYPWMLCGFCDLDRRYDRLIYLLEVAEENELLPKSIAHAAVLGTRQVAGSACAGQGFPINWTSPQEAAAIEQYLKEIDRNELLHRFTRTLEHPKRNVYKGPLMTHRCSVEECVEWFHSSSSDLQQLTTFYSSARQTGFGVIVLRD